MPTYVYECRPCNTVFTQVRPIEDRDLPATCQKCAASSTKRLFAQPFAIQATDRTASPPAAGFPTTQGTRQAVDTPFQVENVEIRNFRSGTGMRVRGSAWVAARNLRFSENETSVEVRDDARLDDYGTVIE